MAVRYGFGAVHVNDDEAATHLVPSEEGAEQAVANILNNNDDSLLFHDSVGDSNNKSATSSPPTVSKCGIWASANSANRFLDAPASPTRAPINHVVGDADYFDAQSSGSHTCPSLIEFSSEDSNDAGIPSPDQVPQRDYGEPFLTLTVEEHAAMAAIVAPAHSKLLKLKELTPDKMPTYHGELRTKSHVQVLKTRLEAVARLYVGEHLSSDAGCRTELMLCRYIATEYWPLPLTPTTHLDIYRIYRNALFRQLSSGQFEKEQAKHREWVVAVADTKRPAMSFGEAASRFASARQALSDAINATMAEDLEKRRKQEEEDRNQALRLDREINSAGLYAGLDYGPIDYGSSYGRHEVAKIAETKILENVAQDSSAGAQTQSENGQHGPYPDVYCGFKNDEELARWLQDQEDNACDDMPGLIYQQYAFDNRKREDQIATDRAKALQLTKDDMKNLARTRSQATKAAIAAQAGLENGELNEVSNSQFGTLIDVSTSPPLARSRSAYSLSLGPIAPLDYGDGDIQEVGASDEDEHIAMMQDPPTTLHRGQKRQDREYDHYDDYSW